MGFIINVHADSTLLGLKSSKIHSQGNSKALRTQTECNARGDSATDQDQKAQDGLSEARSSYKIPHGGLFEFVSCANYCEWLYFFSVSLSIA